MQEDWWLTQDRWNHKTAIYPKSIANGPHKQNAGESKSYLQISVKHRDTKQLTVGNGELYNALETPEVPQRVPVSLLSVTATYENGNQSYKGQWGKLHWSSQNQWVMTDVQ